MQRLRTTQSTELCADMTAEDAMKTASRAEAIAERAKARAERAARQVAALSREVETLKRRIDEEFASRKRQRTALQESRQGRGEWPQGVVRGEMEIWCWLCAA